MILREYLVKLGFRVDDPTWGKFQAIVSSIGKDVATLGAEAVAAATAVGIAVDRVASHYAELYYVGQRAGQGVAFLRSYELASRQIGISAEQATATVNAMGIALRTNPGLAALYGGLTGQRPGAGGLYAVSPQKLVERLSRLPDFVAVQFAGMFGMSAEEYMQRKDNQKVFDENLVYYNDMLREAGLVTKEGKDLVGPDMVAIHRSLTKVQDSFSVLNDLIIKDLVDSGVIEDVASGLRKFTLTFAANDHILEQKFGLVGLSLGNLTAAIGLLIGELTIERILAAFFGFKKGPVAALAIAGGKGLGALGTALLSKGKGAAVVYELAYEALKAAKKDDPETKRKLQELLGPIFYKLGLSTSPNLTGEPTGAAAPALPIPPPIITRRGVGSRSFRNNNPGNIKYGPFAASHGAIGQDSGGFAVFPDYATGAATQAMLWASPGYANLPLSVALNKWGTGAGALPPDISGGETFSHLTRPQRSELFAAQREKEGWFAPGGKMFAPKDFGTTDNSRSVTVTNHVTVNVPPGTTNAKDIANQSANRISQALTRSLVFAFR